MKRLAIVAVTALAVAGCGDTTDPELKLKQCVDSWNRGASELRQYIATNPSLRFSRFNGGECALTVNMDGVIGMFVVRDGQWQNYAGQPRSVGELQLMAREMTRLAGLAYEAGQKEPNALPDGMGGARPIAGREIGEIGGSL